MKTKAFFQSTLYFSSLSFRLCSPLEQAAFLTGLSVNASAVRARLEGRIVASVTGA